MSILDSIGYHVEMRQLTAGGTVKYLYPTNTSEDVIVDSNGNNLVVSDNKFTIYKIKTFGDDKVKSTMDFFKNEKEFRKAIDTLNGAATRGGKTLYFRTITSESFADVSIASSRL